MTKQLHVLIDGAWVEVGGPPGSPGADSTVPGPEGPQGPQGPPGTAYLNAQWSFNQNTASPPAAGTIRMNATTYAAVTTLWVHEEDRDGLDRQAGLDLVAVGEQIIMQSPQGRAVWEVSAVADSGTYRTITVTMVESSGSRPAGGAPTTLYFASVGGSGLDQATADARYVNVAGDTMSGDLLVLGALNIGGNVWADGTLGGNNIWAGVEVGGAHGFFTGGAGMGGSRVENVGAPLSDTDATNKLYVDSRTPKVIVLAAADPVPGGTAVGTVIIRTT